MVDSSVGRIPPFQQPQITEANPGAGLSKGIELGSQMGYRIQEARAQQQQIAIQQQQLALAQQKQAEEMEQEKIKNSLAQFGQLTNLYKNTHKSLRPRLWATMAKKSNELLGTNFDPTIMPEGADDAIDAAHQEIQNLVQGKQSFGDTVKKMAMISTQITDEQKTAFQEAKGFLEMTPEAMKLKAENAPTGSFDFKGYDPATKQQIFGYSKSPTLMTSDGKPYSGPVLSKNEFDKINEETRKVQGIQQSWNELKTLLADIPPGIKGASESAATKLPGGKLTFPKVGQYMDQLPAISAAYYRAATGDTKLSDADAQARAIPYMVLPSDAASVRASKTAMIDNSLERRLKALAQGIPEVSWNPRGTDEAAPSATAPKATLSTDAQALIKKWEGK